jgi:hypothetical protein
MLWIRFYLSWAAQTISPFFPALILEPLCTARSITNTRTTIGSGIFTDFLQIVHSGTKPTPIFTIISSSIFLIENKLSVPSYALPLDFESRVKEVLLEKPGKTSPASPRFAPFSKSFFPSACMSATRGLLASILSAIESSIWYRTRIQSRRISNTRKTHLKGHVQVTQHHARCFPILDQEIFRAGLVSFRPESVHFAVDLYIRYRNAPI